MEKEIVSFVIGAGVVGCVWLGTTFCKSKPAVVSTPVATAQKNAVKQLNSLKKPLTGVYSAKADKNFPGLKLYDTDFLIPWNRTVITEYAVFDDPKANYGSGNSLMSVFMFKIAEKGKSLYFMTAGRQGGGISK